jgi:hypothetical protein
MTLHTIKGATRLFFPSRVERCSAPTKGHSGVLGLRVCRGAVWVLPTSGVNTGVNYVAPHLPDATSYRRVKIRISLGQCFELAKVELHC